MSLTLSTKPFETDDDVSISPQSSHNTQAANGDQKTVGDFFNPSSTVTKVCAPSEVLHRHNIGFRTGFTPPYPSIQIAALLIFLSALIEFSVVILPALSSCVVAPVIGTVLAFLYSILAIFWVRTSIVDPVDVRVLKKIQEAHDADVEDGIIQKTKTLCGCLYATMNNRSRGIPRQSHESFTKFCTLCDTNVHEDSAHCLRCNMCVYRFDHHCSILNKCIGEANYFDFFRTMLCALTVAGFFVILHLYFILEFIANPASNHPFIGKPIIFSIVGAFLSLHIMLCVYLGSLVHAHLHLRAKNMTLHQYTLELLNEFPLEPESHPSFET